MLRAFVIVGVSCLCLGLFCPLLASAQEPVPAEAPPVEQAPAEGDVQTYGPTDEATMDRSYGGHNHHNITGQFYYRVRREISSFKDVVVDVPHQVWGWRWDEYTCSNIPYAYTFNRRVTRRIPTKDFVTEVFCKTITLRERDVRATDPCHCDDADFLRGATRNGHNHPRSAPAAAPIGDEADVGQQSQSVAAYRQPERQGGASNSAISRATLKRPQVTTAANYVIQGSAQTTSDSSAVPAYWTQMQPVVYLAPTVQFAPR